MVLVMKRVGSNSGDQWAVCSATPNSWGNQAYLVRVGQQSHNCRFPTFSFPRPRNWEGAPPTNVGNETYGHRFQITKCYPSAQARPPAGEGEGGQ